MTEPEIPQKRPYPMQVEAGKEYHVCMKLESVMEHIVPYDREKLV